VETSVSQVCGKFALETHPYIILIRLVRSLFIDHGIVFLRLPKPDLDGATYPGRGAITPDFYELKNKNYFIGYVKLMNSLKSPFNEFWVSAPTVIKMKLMPHSVKLIEVDPVP
jgi:hypothetical protein